MGKKGSRGKGGGGSTDTTPSKGTAAGGGEITEAEDAAAAAEVAATAYRLRRENEDLRLQMSAQNEILGKKNEAYAQLAAEMASVKQGAALLSIENPAAATTLNQLISPAKARASSSAASAAPMASPAAATAPRAPPNSVAKEVVRPGSPNEFELSGTMPPVLESPVGDGVLSLARAMIDDGRPSLSPGDDGDSGNDIGGNGDHGNGNGNDSDSSSRGTTTPPEPVLLSSGNPFDSTPVQHPEEGDFSPCPAFEAVDDPTTATPQLKNTPERATPTPQRRRGGSNNLATTSPARKVFGGLEEEMASGLGLGGGGGGGTSSALVLPTSAGGRDEVNELRQQKSTFLQSSGELAELLLSLRREMDFEQKTLAHIRYVLGNLWERITGVAREMSVAGGANASVTTSALDPAVSTQQTLQMTLQEKDRVYESVSEEELTLKKKLEALYDLLGAKNESLVAATERGQPAMSDDFKNFEEEIVDLTTTIETTQDELSRLAMRRDDVRHEALMIQRRMNDGDIVLHSAPSKGLDPVEALRRSIDAGLMQAIGGDLPAPLDSAVVMAERLTGEADEQLRGRREVTFADFMKLDGKVARFAGEDPRAYKSRVAHLVWWGRIYEERQHSIVKDLEAQIARAVEKQRETREQTLRIDVALSRKESDLRFLQVSSLHSLLQQKEMVIEEQRLVLNSLLKANAQSSPAPAAALNLAIKSLPSSAKSVEATVAESAAAKADQAAEAVSYGVEVSGILSGSEAMSPLPAAGDASATGGAALTPPLYLSPSRASLAALAASGDPSSTPHHSATSPAQDATWPTQTNGDVAERNPSSSSSSSSCSSSSSSSPKPRTGRLRKGTTIIARLRDAISKLQDARRKFRTGSRSGVDEDAEGTSLAYVQLTVVKARDLPPVMRTSNTCSAFVSVAITPAGQSVVSSTSSPSHPAAAQKANCTETQRQTLYPTWNSEFIIRGVPHSSAIVRFTVFHNSGMRTNSQLRHEHGTGDDAIGFAEVDLSTVMDQRKHFLDLAIEPPVESLSPSWSSAVVPSRGRGRRSSSLGPLSSRRKRGNAGKQSTLRVAVRFVHDRVARLEEIKQKLQAELRKEQERMEDLEAARAALGASPDMNPAPPPYVPPPEELPATPMKSPAKVPSELYVERRSASPPARHVRSSAANYDPTIQKVAAPGASTQSSAATSRRTLTSRSARRNQALRSRQASLAQSKPATPSSVSATRSRQGRPSSIRMPTPPTEEPRAGLEASAAAEGGVVGAQSSGAEPPEPPRASETSSRPNGLSRSKKLSGSPVRVATAPKLR